MPLGGKFSSPPNSALERAATRWFNKEKPSLKLRCASGKTVPGQYFDSETNLHYNYFRDYDPSIGRYIQSDPIGLDGGSNTYSYVNSNPLIYTDLFGLYSPNSNEHLQRNRKNKCPKCEPKDGSVDCLGNTWESDRGAKAGGYHGAKEFGWKTYRAKDLKNPPGGFQCTYDLKGGLVTTGKYRGTYDYHSPMWTMSYNLSSFLYHVRKHFKYDVDPHNANDNYEISDKTQIICQNKCCK